MEIRYNRFGQKKKYYPINDKIMKQIEFKSKCKISNPST